MRELSTQVVRPKLSPRLAVLKVGGFVNAATLMEFEAVLDELLMDARRDVVLDCQALGYANSSGIAALLNYQQSFQARGGDLVLVRVPRGIAIVLYNLGTTGRLAILRDEPDALAYLERGADGARRWTAPGPYLHKHHPGGTAAPNVGGASAPKAAKPRAVVPLLEARPPGAARGILMIEPSRDDFADVIRLRYHARGGRRGRVVLVHDCVSALTQFEKADPDVIILRDTIPNAEAFLVKVKTERGRSLASVIRIYANGAPPRPQEFRIRENDAFTEPFEIGELFALAEMELARVPKARGELNHMTSFEAVTTPPNLEKAGRLARSLISSTGMQEDAAAGFLASFKECLDNAARHAHAGSTSKRCTVHFLVDPGKATFVVQDEGPGFDHAYYTSRLDDEDAYVKARRAKAEGRPGGLGILLMHKNCDALVYEGGGSRIRIEKRLA